MELRKVQKTNDMHYIYLPTAWCKKHSITNDSRLSIQESPSGSLVLSQTEAKKLLKKLQIKLSEEDQDIINKVIVACYLNPLASFKIDLDKEITAKKLLNQKSILSLESVEIEKKTISCDSNMAPSEPGLLFKTMVKKIKNLATVLANNYDEELINRYEEEIDRNKMHIQKSIISYMTMSAPKQDMIDLYYISLMTTDLERAVDHIILLKPKDHKYINQVIKVLEKLKAITDSMDEKFSYKEALELVKSVKDIRDQNTYDKHRINDLLANVSEIILDWSITNEITK